MSGFYSLWSDSFCILYPPSRESNGFCKSHFQYHVWKFSACASFKILSSFLKLMKNILQDQNSISLYQNVWNSFFPPVFSSRLSFLISKLLRSSYYLDPKSSFSAHCCDRSCAHTVVLLTFPEFWIAKAEGQIMIAQYNAAYKVCTGPFP